MEHHFHLSCESTVDLPYDYVTARDISVIFYAYSVDDCEYPDDMGREAESLPRFYRWLREGKMPSTSQINEFRYIEYFEKLLNEYDGDILHIALGSGMTPSVKNACAAAEKLMEKYPDRRIAVEDSLCSSSGYGLLTDCAADLRDEGKSMDEVLAFVRENRNRVHHQFYTTDISYFRRSGRISGAAAMAASVLNICPIMRLDDKGKIIAYDKVRGHKGALKETIRTMGVHIEKGKDYSNKCFICHSDCLDEALRAKDAIAEAFPHISGDIRICDIGTIIASHCGPGTVAVFFFGDERTPDC